jgi:hypothetical protein
MMRGPAIFVLSLLAASAQAKNVIIRSDPGGLIESYAREFHDIAARGDRIVIDGPCFSACTIALSLPTTCVTDRAVLGFHLPRQLGEDSKVELSLEMASLMWGFYPPAIQQWLRDRGGLGPHIKYLRGRDLMKLVKRCND